MIVCWFMCETYTHTHTHTHTTFKVHLEFIQVCVHRLKVIYDGLQQYEPGEIERERPEVQQGHKTEVSHE